MRKQLDYANKKGVPYVILLGDEEIQEEKLTLKDMRTGMQERVTLEIALAALC